MDSVPSTSSVQVSPPKKRKILEMGHLTLAQKQGILNLYEQIVTNKPQMKKLAVIAKIVDTMGVARSAAYRVIKEYKDTREIRNPRSVGGRPSTFTNADDIEKNATW